MAHEPAGERNATTEADRPPGTARLAAGALAFVGLAVSGAALLRALAPGATPPLDAAEVILYVALLLALFRVSPRLWRTVSALPRAHTVPLAAMFLLMFVAQLFGVSRATFPFATWTMYGSEDRPEVSLYHRLVGRRGDGVPVAVEPRELFPSVANWAMIARLDEAAAASEAGPLNELAAAYLVRFNEEHPTETLSSLAIERCLAPILPRGAAQCVELVAAATGVAP